MSFTDEQIARIAHAAIRELQQILGDKQIPPPWDHVSEHDREMSIASARIGRHGASPEVLHEQWATKKQAAGWTPGETKDAEAKTHPLLVPFDQLPPGDRAKDYLFAGICTAMNAASDVKARAENELLALAEAEELTRRQAQNQALRPGHTPFDGATPIAIDAAEARPPKRAQED